MCKIFKLTQLEKICQDDWGNYTNPAMSLPKNVPTTF